MFKLHAICLIAIIALTEIIEATPIGLNLLLHSGTTVSDLQTSLHDIKTLGASDVVFQIYEFQRTGKSTDIFPIPQKSAPLELLRQSLVLAHKEGFSVTLLPVLLLDAPTKDDWRGNIKPTDFKL